MFKDTPIYAALKKVSRMNSFTAFQVVFNTPTVKNMVIEMNTQEQLYDKGIGSDGVSLESIGGEYSFVTKDIKSSSGQRYDHVTLNDTGDFYKSWRVSIMGEVIFIEADIIKDGDDLQQRWGGSILGLTDESKQKLINYAVVKYREYLLKQWQV